MSNVLDRDEFVEQAYFFRVFRERLIENVPAQEILARAHEELLTTTKLPMAVQFLSAEIRHAGILGPGFVRLSHYFTPFQAFLVRMAEDEKRKFSMPTALVVLEREAHYKANQPSPAGLFVFHFETIARNKLGYDEGLKAVAGDPMYDENWKNYVGLVRRSAGAIDFTDLVYVRSELYVTDQRRTHPDYVPPVQPIFGEKEGKIAKASRGRDPLFLFAALQRQLGYPEVPKPKKSDDLEAVIRKMEARLREAEARIRILEAEQRGTFDPTQFGRPDIFRDIKDDDEKDLR
ncbi:hypothetical protein [Limnoglobus roseus]|uniref:Uncharacterized protein n=1 Tax=Limnoglobus roseus TaxID=2598579 RepID=A0A5C1ALV4_9BACT|nr:hypothetical protein [Limnoglobus roseus]QEL18956.1 hypothetical protein PX52LOC_06006 [Limnoglobus roseus]